MTHKYRKGLLIVMFTCGGYGIACNIYLNTIFQPFQYIPIPFANSLNDRPTISRYIIALSGRNVSETCIAIVKEYTQYGIPYASLHIQREKDSSLQIP